MTDSAEPVLAFDVQPDPDDIWTRFRALAPGTRIPVLDRDGRHVANAVLGDVTEEGDGHGWLEVRLPADPLD